jgi:hypothetical protein
MVLGSNRTKREYEALVRIDLTDFADPAKRGAMESVALAQFARLSAFAKRLEEEGGDDALVEQADILCERASVFWRQDRPDLTYLIAWAFLHQMEGTTGDGPVSFAVTAAGGWDDYQRELDYVMGRDWPDPDEFDTLFDVAPTRYRH